MSKIGLIIGREYASRVKKKSFIIMTILVPILSVGFLIAAVFLGMPEPKNYRILVVDDSYIKVSKYFMSTEEIAEKAGFKPMFDNDGAFVDPDKESGENYYLNAFDPTGKKTYEEALNEFEQNDAYDLIIYLPPDINKFPVKVTYKESPSAKAQKNIYALVNKSIEKAKLSNFSIPSVSKDVDAMIKEKTKELYEDIKSKTRVQFVNLKDKDEKIEMRAAIGFFFGLFIFMFIFLYGVQVMRGVIEEKTNRIVEVIVSSVKPFELMMGKIIGIMMVGLTQFFMWVMLIGVCSIFVVPAILPDKYSAGYQAEITDVNIQATEGVNDMINANGDAPITLQDNEMINFLFNEVPWGSMIGLFIFYFIAGYLLYGSLMAAIGSAVDSETDTQQFMLPVTLPLTFAYLISIMGISDPNSTVMMVCSQVPFTSPICMLVRFATNVENGMTLELISSMVLIILTFIGTTWLAAKIYRTGILMYGKKITYKEIFKWLRY